MSGSSPPIGVELDTSRLTSALRRINGARRSSVGSLSRLRQLIGGFEALLEAAPQRASRELDGARALDELETILTSHGADAGAESLRGFFEPIIDRLIEALLNFPERRLAAYGSLLPGKENHHHVSVLVGEWIDGEVEGILHIPRWAAKKRFPGLVWDSSGSPVAVRVFQSAALPESWDRLDEFERGFSYHRSLVPVSTGQGTLVCNLYELSESEAHAE